MQGQVACGRRPSLGVAGTPRAWRLTPSHLGMAGRQIAKEGKSSGAEMPGESSRRCVPGFVPSRNTLHNRGAGTDAGSSVAFWFLFLQKLTPHTSRGIPDDHVTHAASRAINLVPDSFLPPSSSPAALLNAGTETSGVSALQDSYSEAQSKSQLRGLNAWGTEQCQHLVHLPACSQPPVHSPERVPTTCCPPARAPGSSTAFFPSSLPHLLPPGHTQPF